MLATGIIAYLIPDIPKKLNEQVRREAYLTNEIILKTEFIISQGDKDISDAELIKLDKEGVITNMEMTRLRKRLRVALNNSNAGKDNTVAEETCVVNVNSFNN